MATPKPAAKPTAPSPKPAAGAKGAPTPPANEDVAVPPKKSRKVLFLVLGLVALLLAGGGGAAWYFLAGPGAAHPPAKDGKDGKDTKATEKDGHGKPPVFVNLEQFTVNLAPESGDRYLQAAIVLQLDDDKAAENIKVYMPVLRNRVLMLLSSKKPSELETVEGKKQLVDELVAATRDSIPGSTPTRGVSGALFSSFVIQ